MIMRNREGPKKLKALKSDGFIHIPMSFTFELTVTDAQMDQLADRIVYEGIGDWVRYTQQHINRGLKGYHYQGVKII